MQSRAASLAPKQFKSPRKSLGEVDAAGLAKLLAASSDLAVVVDEAGKLHDLSTSIPALLRANVGDLIGGNILDVLTAESRPKAEKLIKDALAGAPARLRELNLALRAGAMATVNCGAMQVGDKGRVLMFGRDLSATTAIQQRLIAAQAEAEREYARLRQAETRFAVLFDSCSDAMLIVAPATLRITEINPPGVALIGKSSKRILGRTLPDLFDAPGARAVTTMLAAIQSAGYADQVNARLDDRETRVSASLFRQDGGVQFLVRLELVDEGPNLIRNAPDLGELVEALPDAFVVTDADFRLLKANAAFLDMVQVASLSHVRDQPLERWLGRPGIDIGALGAILKQHGVARNFHTIVRGARGLDEDVEVSALAIADPDRPTINISMRAVPRRRAASSRPGHELPQSVEQMTELVGRVPLKDMVREATDWIERLSIEAALIVTGDNRASAADMLGFSRQSLYMKMRRYGLGDSEPDEEA